MITEQVQVHEGRQSKIVNKDGLEYGAIATIIQFSDSASHSGEVYQYTRDSIWKLQISRYAFSDAVGARQSEIFAEHRKLREMGLKPPFRIGVPGSDLAVWTFRSNDRRYKNNIRQIMMYRSHVLTTECQPDTEEDLARLDGQNQLAYLIRINWFCHGSLRLAIDKDNVPMLVRTKSKQGSLRFET